MRQALAAPPPNLTPAANPHSHPPAVCRLPQPHLHPEIHPPSTCSARLGRRRSTGTTGRPNTDPARQHQPQHQQQHQRRHQQRQGQKSTKQRGIPPRCPCPRTVRPGVVAANQGVVMGEVEEARGNLQTLPGKVERWEAKVDRCWQLGDVFGGERCSQKSFGGKVPAKGGTNGS